MLNHFSRTSRSIHASREAGFSLVEIMVAMLIGLIGIIIITQAYLTSDKFNRSTLGEGGAQVNGLIGLYSIERDARMAGYGINNATALGCGAVSWYYSPNYSPDITSTSPLSVIRIAPAYITTDTATPANPDSLTIMYSSNDERAVPTAVISWASATPEVTVDGTVGFVNGNMVLMVKRASTGGCSMAKISSAPTATKIQFLSGASNPTNPAGWGSLPTGYTTNDIVYNLGTPVVRTYSIYKEKLRVTDALQAAAGTAPMDIVDGVVDLRAEYGKDTDNDGVVETWDKTAPTTSTAWQQVQVIRVAVLARIGNYERPSVAGGNCDATTTAPTWAGGSFPAIDIATTTSQDRCYRYRSFETTVPLRNMIWRQ